MSVSEEKKKNICKPTGLEIGTNRFSPHSFLIFIVFFPSLMWHQQMCKYGYFWANTILKLYISLLTVQMENKFQISKLTEWFNKNSCDILIAKGKPV